jgi:gag-polypeptide of LTR copia-type
MKIVEGTRPYRTRPYPQPAKGQRTAAAPGTRDEKALPRSEAGTKQIRTSHFNDFIKLEDSLRLGNTNWVVWKAHMIVKFQCCGVEGYVNGTIPCPDPAADLEGVENWSCNDNFARVLISWNVTPSEQVHILGCDSAHEMWKNLVDVHRSRGFKTMLAQRRKLCLTIAGEGDNIVGHLDKLKQYRDRINFAGIGGKLFEISDSFFYMIIVQSLPRSWDSFMCDYFAQTDLGDGPGMVSSQRFIDLIEREYRRREQLDRGYIPTHIIT